MRRAESRIERLERKLIIGVPERVTGEWLARQPLSRVEQIAAALPYDDLVRCLDEMEAMKETAREEEGKCTT